MTAEPIQYQPPVECAPWCTYGDGHPCQSRREHQACWSEDEYVALSMEPPVVEDADVYPQRIGVMARRRPDEPGHVYVHLDCIQLHGLIPSPHDVLDHDLTLTPAEALKLAHALIHTAKLVQ